MKKSSNNNKFNSVPSIIFTPIKTSKNISSFFLLLSIFFSIIILVEILFGEISFSQEELKGIADFTLNLVFVVSALGLTIFTLPINVEHPEKEKIMLSYIGTSLLIASISIFTYILSYCTFFNITLLDRFDIFSLYFCAMFFAICTCMTSILSTIIAYFNIRN